MIAIFGKMLPVDWDWKKLFSDALKSQQIVFSKQDHSIKSGSLCVKDKGFLDCMGLTFLGSQIQTNNSIHIYQLKLWVYNWIEPSKDIHDALLPWFNKLVKHEFPTAVDQKNSKDPEGSFIGPEAKILGPWLQEEDKTGACFACRNVKSP